MESNVVSKNPVLYETHVAHFIMTALQDKGLMNATQQDDKLIICTFENNYME